VRTDTNTNIHQNDESQHKQAPRTTAAAGVLSSDSVSVHAMRVCASLNNSDCIAGGQRLGMTDSGCISLILKLDPELRLVVHNMNTSDAISGSSASSQFNTVGSGLVGIRCTFNDKSGNNHSFDEVAKASVAEDWNFDLFPLRWFQRLGHSVIFDGRLHSEDTSDGRVTVNVNKLSATGRTKMGELKLVQWSDLYFSPYNVFPCPAEQD